MKFLKIFLFFSIMLMSASCTRKYVDILYQGQPNYRPLYIVDTIEIENPIVIVRKKGGSFILSKKILESSKLTVNLLSRSDVFRQGDSFYHGLDTTYIKRFNYIDYGGCNSEKCPQFETDEFEVYEYKSKSVRFILELVNASYFNKITNSYTSYDIVNSDLKNSYYKVIYPLCN